MFAGGKGGDGPTSVVAGFRSVDRLTSAKAAKTCTRYISNSWQMPWYTNGAGCRLLQDTAKPVGLLPQYMSGSM